MTMRSVTGAFFILVSVLFGTGCGRVHVGSHYYVAKSKVIKDVPAAQPDNISKSDPTPGTILKNGAATVGFFPAEGCLTPVTTPGAARTLTPECTILLPMLEKKAAAQGYKVVSWTRFGQNPWLAVKQVELDVLFIIEQVNLQWSTPASYKTEEMTFAEVKEGGKTSPVELEDEQRTTEQCKGLHNTYFPTANKESKVEGATLSIQMMSAGDGVKKWHFKKSEQLPADEPTYNELYFEGKGLKKKGLGGAITGGIFTAMGIGALITGVVKYSNGTSLTERNVGAGLAWGSTILFGIGLPIGTVGLLRQFRDPVYPKVDKVLCSTNDVTENPYPKAATEASTSKPATLDTGKQTSTFLETLTSSFFAQLDKIRQEAPLPPVIQTSTIEPSVSPEQAPAEGESNAAESAPVDAKKSSADEKKSKRKTSKKDKHRKFE